MGKWTGAGLDKESAMNNAYQNAVKQAVGLYIDAETLIDNNQEVKDKILTYSRGIIDKVEVISDQNDNGIYRVEILAQVIKQELEEKVKPISSDKASFNIDGESLVAAKVSKEQQEADAKAILEEIYSYMIQEAPNWLDFSIDGDPRISENHDYVEVDVIGIFNFNKYLNTIQKPIDMLDQIAVSKTEITSSDQRNDFLRISEFSTPIYDGQKNIFLIEKWRSNNYKQRKWILYELPIIPSFLKEINNKTLTINAEIKSNKNEPIALGFYKVNFSNKMQSSNDNYYIMHDLRRAWAGLLYMTKKPFKTTIRIPIEPNQIADIDSVEISVN